MLGFHMLTLIFIACLKSPAGTSHKVDSTETSDVEQGTEGSEIQPAQTAPEATPLLTGVNNQTEKLLTTGVIESPSSNPIGEVSITYRRLYKNGCIEQKEDRIEVNPEQLSITHYLFVSDRSTEPGAMCTLALRPGGFTHSASLNKPGKWSGRVIVNDQQVTTYELTVTD